MATWDQDPVVKTASADVPREVPASPSWINDPIVDDLKGLDFNGPTSDVRSRIDTLSPQLRIKALNKWADQYVGKERQGGAGQYIGDMVRNVARGTPVGSWLDEANAATAAGVHALTGGHAGAPYDEAKAYQNALDRAADTQTAKVGTLPDAVPFVGGHEVTGADLTKLAGGALSAGLAPVWRGATWLGSTARGAASGAGYGAVYGAGEGDTIDERIENAKRGATVGSVLGAAAPSIGATAGAIGQGATNVGNWAAGQFARDAALAPYHRAAVREVARHYQTDELAPIAERRAAELGPQGMIGDMGDASRMATAGLARTPGGEPAVQALRDRQIGAPARINAAIDETVGPQQNVLAVERELRRAYGRAAAPHYDEFYNTPIPHEDHLVSLLHAIPPDIYANAERLMRLERIDPNSISGTGRMIDYIKRGIDQSAEDAGRHTTLGRAYGNLARDLRHSVDNILSPNNPAESSWARARSIAGEGIEGREALDAGAGLFKQKRDPHAVEAELADMSNLGRETYRTGARNDLRQIVGRASSNFGPTGDNAARRALNNEFSRENLNQVIGPEGANRLTGVIDAENTMAGLDEMARRNSITSTMNAVQKTLPQPIDASQVPFNVHAATIPGLLLSTAHKALNVVTAGQWNARQASIASDMARMLTARGEPRDAIIRALNGYVGHVTRGRASGRLVNDMVSEIVRDAASGARGPAIDSGTGASSP